MTIRIEHGDCRDVIARLVDEGIAVDAVVTDPPYELNFMSRKWDNTGISFRPETWATIAEVMKPGAHLVAFGGTRTYHRMACALEDAGFELRECLLWLYGSGFPKSLDISKAIDKAAGVEREVLGPKVYADGTTGHFSDAAVYGTVSDGVIKMATAPATPAAQQWAGWGTALKPSYEPIILARKPLSEPTVAGNVLKHGVGGLNIDAGRVEWPDGKIPEIASGRWPSNLLHDGSQEVLEAFAAFGKAGGGDKRGQCEGRRPSGFGDVGPNSMVYSDTGTAARFFPAPGYSEEELRFMYCPKASKADRMGTTHPTTKPTSLISWLSKLICPPGGTILDPFAGSGSLAVAAQNLGFDAILIEREAEYVEMIRARLKHMADKQGGQGKLNF